MSTWRKRHDATIEEYLQRANGDVDMAVQLIDNAVRDLSLPSDGEDMLTLSGPGTITSTKGVNKMKKFVVLCVSFVLLFTLTSCDKEDASAVRCDSCGEKMSEDNKFCPDCGAAAGTITSETATSTAVDFWRPGDSAFTTKTNPSTTALSSTKKTTTTTKTTPTTPQGAEMIKQRLKIYGTSISVNSADGVDVYIQWENLSEKEIKYMYFCVGLYNRVGDLLECDISADGEQWLSQTGPIPQGKGMYNSMGMSVTSGGERPFRPDVSYEEYKVDEENGWADCHWDCVWYNSQAHYVKILGVEIEYMDGTVFSETNKSIFESLGIINLNINDDISDYVWEYPVSAELLASDFPYSEEGLYIETLLIDKVIGSGPNEALFVCRLQGYSDSGFISVYVDVVDDGGNDVEIGASTEVHIPNKGDFTSYEFYVTTPAEGTYYLVIKYIL